MPDGTLTELLNALDSDELRRGKQFEKIVKWWLQNDTTRSRNIKTVWLWDEWPDRPGRDIGVDLVAELLDGSLCAIQAKCFASERDVPKSEIDSFISAASPRTFAQRWLVATTNGLSANARRTIHDNHVTFVPLAELEAAAVTWPSNPNALKAAKKLNRAKPRPHQQRAIRDVLKGLEANDKGQLIMACGTGKTLTALWITERLDSQTTLVLVPSLNLLSQTLTEWAHNTSTKWSYICVCSDDTVNKEDDQPINTTVDLPYPVTTKPADIADFLKRRGPKIVFSTYQSSAHVAKAQKLSRKKFELVICDEAHRLTGKTEADYATVLDEKKIISKKRLFMTATPRTYTANVKAKAEERGVEITSMDDPHVYGPQFHRLTFGEAIKQELLTDYQVVIVGVTDPQVQELIDRRELVSVNNTVTTDARTLAAHIGLAKATKDFNLARTISFHSRIKTAAQFASDHPKILEWLPTTHKPEGSTWTDTISGDMNTGQRRTLLQHLRKDQPGRHALLTNARCLTEGVDVPTLDGVAFIDPRSSQVDIIQAVGRAIRRSTSKNIGTIVLPVLIPHQADPDQALSDSAFKPIWAILNALKSHDQDLSEQLDTLRAELGRTSSVRDFPSKIQIDLPISTLHQMLDIVTSIRLSILEEVTDTWSHFFGLLQRHVDTTGSARVPSHHRSADYSLGAWVTFQRSAYRNTGKSWGALTPTRVKLLESLPGWSWDPREDAWESAFELLQRRVNSTGSSLLPDGFVVDGFALSAWCNSQRITYRKGSLNQERQTRLQQLPDWYWNKSDESWIKAISSLREFYATNGHYEPDDDYLISDGRSLRRWANKVRAKYIAEKLRQQRIDELEAMPNWTWKPRFDRFVIGLQDLITFQKENGHLNPPEDFVTSSGIDLLQWKKNKIAEYRRGELSSDRARLVEQIPGWTWEPQSERFSRPLGEIKQFQTKYGHLRIPPDLCDSSGVNLSAWIKTRRREYRLGKLAPEKTKALEELPGWSWGT